MAGSLGAKELAIAVASPSPRLLEADLMPSISDYFSIPEVIDSYVEATRGFVQREGNKFQKNSSRYFYCFAMRGEGYNITPKGKLSFCCNLSQIDQGGCKDCEKDVLADLNEESLAKAISHHAQAVSDYIAHLMAKEEVGEMTDVDYFQCLECAKYFGKLDWLKKRPGEWRKFIWGS